MKKLLLAVALVLGMASSVFADGFNTVINDTTRNPQWTVTVYNDHGGEIVSGDVVMWDDDDTDFSTSEFPYVVRADAADDPYVAGVVATGLTCADQQLCEIVVYGPVTTKIADASDDATVDTLVSSSTVSGRAGDAGQGGNTCSLGQLVDIVDDGTDGAVGTVFVNITCD